MNTWMRILIRVGVFSLMPTAASIADPCLEYGTVSLRGTMVRQTYAGPPDYESITQGDQPRVIWVLQLERWLCVADSNYRYPKEHNEHEVEIALTADQYTQYQHLLGAKVIATGQLLHGGANYQKRLVLTASDIEKTSLVP